MEMSEDRLVIKIQILWHRELDPYIGQNAIDDLADQIKKAPGMMGHGGRVTNYATRHENPFPSWAQTMLKDNGFVYEDFNMTYYKDVLTRAEEAEQREWFEKMHEWLKAKNFPQADKLFYRSNLPIYDQHGLGTQDKDDY